MHVRSLTSAILMTCTAALLGGPSFAEDAAPANAVAIARAKLQLVAGAEMIAAAAHAPTVGAAGSDGVSRFNDPISERLEAAFMVAVPELAAAKSGVEAARLPQPRPAAPEPELVALAYAATPRPAAAGSRAGGLSAIEALVEKHAEANDIPPALAQALVHVESTHNPRATGRNGEIGLLQIKAQTARAMGYKGPAQDLYDPETNLAWGMKYLGKAHDLSGGDVCGTLLRYNAGLDAKRMSAASNKFCAKVKAVMAKRA
jgi:soluble lytic murein transglycosylase-like protein